MASPVSIISTIARASLGVIFRTAFVEGKHLEEDRVWNEDEGMYFATNQMSWYLRKVRPKSAMR